MRETISISLPLRLIKMIKQEVKDGNYININEFFCSLLRVYKEESDLLVAIEESEREFEAGEGKVLKSFKDLR